MISVVVTLFREEPAVVDTLAALVPGVAEGLLRDVWLAAPAGLAFADDIADAAGCSLVSGGSALDRCRCASVLVIEGGIVPTGLWMQAAEDFLSASGRRETQAPVGAFPVGDSYGRIGMAASATQRLRAKLGRSLRGQPLIGPKTGVTALAESRRWPVVLLKPVAADRRNGSA